jgi:tetratricopeptide (TPR) repeat protein
VKADFVDLSARARRGELNDSEERQLRLLLRGSLEAQLAHRAGCEFDAQDSMLPLDDALAERVTRRLLVQTQPIRRAPHRIGWKFAIAGALTVAAAAAAPQLAERVGVSLPWGTELAEVVRTAPPVPEPAAARRGERAPSAPVAEVLSPAAALSEPIAPKSLELYSTPAPSARDDQPRSSTGETPAKLFAEANRARRSGQLTQATALYQELQRRHPSAVEARAADIALGMLYSGRSPTLALSHFRQYLQRGGPLALEALWGQAQALSDLGRPEEAREVYRALLTRYPRSTYANAASAKLGMQP